MEHSSNGLRVRISYRFPARHVLISHDASESLTYNFKLTNELGMVLCTIEALEVAAHGRVPLIVKNRYDMAYHQLDIHLPRLTEISTDEATCMAESQGMRGVRGV